MITNEGVAAAVAVVTAADEPEPVGKPAPTRAEDTAGRPAR